MRLRCSLELDLGDEWLADLVHRALLPEVRSPPSFRSSATVGREGTKVVLTVESGDVSSLRAALNGYLRVLSAVLETITPR